jgi:DNA polymerase V
MFGLVDGNNFYVSCERAFNPRLAGVPVVVLSNNDGCVISRSAEAKALCIAMGEPYFKIKHLVPTHGIQVFSSNYALYGDMSRRLMGYLGEIAPGQEIYSIDECFLDLSGMDRWVAPDLVAYAQGIRTEILQRTHIPTCIGMAPTKTLAKLANRIAKKYPAFNGVVNLNDPVRRQRALKLVAVGDVWGIGQQYTSKLAAQGISTAADLSACSESWARKHLGGVVGACLVRELQGYPCLALAPSEDGTLARQSIACSRSFGQPLSSFPDVLGAVAAFTSRAAEKLRRQKSVVNILTVFLNKNRFGTEPPPYSFPTSITLSVPTADTLELVRLARLALKRIWVPGTVYKKVGVVFSGLEGAVGGNLDMFSDHRQAATSAALMSRLDALNQRYGSGTVKVAVALPITKVAPWYGLSQQRSPEYTTSWDGLWQVRI